MYPQLCIEVMLTGAYPWVALPVTPRESLFSLSWERCWMELKVDWHLINGFDNLGHLDVCLGLYMQYVQRCKTVPLVTERVQYSYINYLFSEKLSCSELSLGKPFSSSF